MAQVHAQQAVETLAQCLTDPEASWPAKIHAASELLDRGFGRPPQALDVTQRHSISEEFEAFVREMQTGRRATDAVQTKAE
jgi:hypothetical protein